MAHLAQGLLGHVQAGHLGALQGHELPTGDRGVAAVLRPIAPAAATGILRLDDEIDRFLGRLAELAVLGHAVGLAEGHRGDAVTVIDAWASEP